MSSALIMHPDTGLHILPAGQPECVDRITAISKAIDSPEFSSLVRLKCPQAEFSWANLVHDPAFVSEVHRLIPKKGFHHLASDTMLCPTSGRAIQRALGGVRKAVDAVMNSDFRNAFVAMRPPGHHAERSRAMGFCVFNHAALAARYALDTYDIKRVGIVDFDVHHGNGTEDIVSADSQIFFSSVHQAPLYPGTGRADDVGIGNVLNCPLPPGSAGAEYRDVFVNRIEPAISAFQPELIVVSAGFDAHAHDPLAQMDCRSGDFGWMTRRITSWAQDHCQGRLISILEGGYHLAALGRSVQAHLRELIRAGDAPDFASLR